MSGGSNGRAGSGQLAALCQRLGATGHGITAPPAAQLPERWASVIAHLDPPAAADGPEVYVPLARILPDVDGARFAPAAEPSHVSAEGTQAFLLRLTPPLAAVPDTAEVVITGPATQLRATVPVRPA